MTCRATQGTLSALTWEHVSIADSLAMGDAAVRMAQEGVTSVACLGVDFMAESVRATLDAKGFQGVPVSRSVFLCWVVLCISLVSSLCVPLAFL